MRCFVGEALSMAVFCRLARQTESERVIQDAITQTIENPDVTPVLCAAWQASARKLIAIGGTANQKDFACTARRLQRRRPEYQCF